VVAPVLSEMTTTVSPSPMPTRQPVMVTVTATDRVTGAPVPGNVVVGGVAKGITGTPFTLTIPAHRLLVDGEWEWVPVVPAASVEAPGYNPGAVVFDVIP
jgi:hypothetical protein